MTRLSTTLRRFIRPLIGTLAILLTFALLFISSRTATTVQANDEVSTPRTETITVTFPGTGVGAIPDGNSGTPPQFGTPLNISFNVTGLTGNVTAVSVNYNVNHSWVGDVETTLLAPGGSPSLITASRIGVTTATGFGDSSNYGGVYNFIDSATGTNIWTVATSTACTDLCTVTPGDYRTTQGGQVGTPNPAPFTSLNTTFGGLTPGQANGTWTLRFRDAASADTGDVSAANLTITTAGGPTPQQHVVDYDGDGKTDYSVVRNTGGGAGGQVTWFNNNGTVASGFAWGISTDFFVPEDYDGDNKTDIAVWRPGAATQAAFYILQSQTNTLRTVVFGQTGDDPTVVGDYDGDNKADPAVYRAGASTGQQSTWFYLGSMNNPGNNITFVPWGVNGDFPAPGDYDGDGKNDFVMQRNTGGGNARFWILFANGTIDNSIVFGTPTDLIVPGDYDGDQKTDIAVVRAGGGNINWFIRQSSNGQMVGGPFGASATDFVTQGDYDGDGKTDLAVWRPAAGTFFVFNSGTNTVSGFGWGANGDFPVANFNTH